MVKPRIDVDVVAVVVIDVPRRVVRNGIVMPVGMQAPPWCPVVVINVVPIVRMHRRRVVDRCRMVVVAMDVVAPTVVATPATRSKNFAG